MPALAQSAFAPFTVSDIRIDGLQRTRGTVFTSIPAEARRLPDAAKAAEAMRALYPNWFVTSGPDHQGGILRVVTPWSSGLRSTSSPVGN